jgi:hypothetical protein
VTPRAETARQFKLLRLSCSHSNNAHRASFFCPAMTRSLKVIAGLRAWCIFKTAAGATRRFQVIACIRTHACWEGEYFVKYWRIPPSNGLRVCVPFLFERRRVSSAVIACVLNHHESA